MKKGKKILASLLVLSFMLGLFFVPSRAIRSNAQTYSENFRGIWVANVFSLHYPSKMTRDENSLKADAVAILDNAKEMGFNAVILQVRSCSDALYSSDLYPWSKYLTGKEGLAPDNRFDPLQFFVEEAHKRGLELHAWINPYRITAKAEDKATLTEQNPAVQHPEWTVTHTDGKMYWNPGEPRVRDYILKGVDEILDNYDVDGIQIDDYFYPGSTFADRSTFEKYGSGFSSIEDWRRDNIDQLVKGIYDTVHAKSADLVFGVSPMGIWANKGTIASGSDTRGSESYNKNYADSRGWVKKGYVDYIIPQIYWNIGFEIADYEKLLNWWCDVVDGTDVDLYIGQAAYRTGNSDSSSPWYGVSEIERQVNLNRTKSQVKGYCMYAYSSFKANADLTALIKRLNKVPLSGGTVEEPSSGNEVPPMTPNDSKCAFIDLEGHWSKPYVELMAQKGIIKGDLYNRAMPDSQIKRADFVLMLLRMLEVETIEDAQGFSDVASDAYYAKQLATAKQIGLINGIGEERFAPENLISRQDMFTMAYRALLHQNKINEEADTSVLAFFSDYGQVQPYASSAMSYFISKKAVNGMNGMLAPTETASRAQAATFLANLIQ
ncbi:family 10 glycosylhydrolase [Sinanaerobacter sp. ZZT-01]|uniref:family 10 glycosylhydrolase n=1 Tax=Sinanaerobacter sp. ZZT-01 TaxID=3111540 RepID=UPI002D77F309|nr:family 10 glycosylhydrolase [Sinanaerobacter sp. ZZT-01]WRR92325.1 family 10 glycosylhydrolase [Sinanaerobacter sp. ZZT-01]